jgi:DNA mismatch repair protein MutS2
LIKRKALQELDYFKVLDLIEEFSNSEATVNAISSIYPATSIQEAETHLKEFEEIKDYLDKGGKISLYYFPDVTELLQKALKEGVFFEAWELTKFLLFLRALDRISPSIEDLLAYPYLTRKIKEILANNLTVGQSYLLEKLENTVDEEGNLLDSASLMLKYIRKQIKITEERIKEKLEEIINRKDINIFLQDTFITKRNDRWVIPVRMDSKGQIKGKVHDVSRSGETAFVEPEQIANLSKKLEELKLEEKVEEMKILREISEFIHQVSNILQREFALIVYLDKLNAIYKFSCQFNAKIPKLTKEKHISLLEAKHPLLILSKPQVAPLDLELKDKKILVITGPNAGGKTVALKTIGLLTAMACSGLPVPASSSSIIPFVSSIYVDFSHEGSIEEELSSFTTHLLTLKEIVENTDDESLNLVDEIGTNTAPEEGSALACAILEELRNKGGFTFVTTHLSKLKFFAATEEGMEIAAMLFDEKNMTPLYRLSIGRLTTSYTMEIAKKYGFPENLINRAYQLKGTEDRKIYELISNLEKAKEEYKEKIEEVEKTKKLILKEKERLEKELKEIEEKKKKLIEEAKIEASSLIKKTKEEINILYEEAKKADKQKLKELSKKATEILMLLHPEDKKISEEIKIGDLVRVKTLNISGKVLTIKDSRAKIQTDKGQIEAKIENLEKISSQQEAEKKYSNRKDFTKESDKGYISKKLDIRGMRTDEALPLVERFLNELSMEEISKGIIIHGIGKGILRDTVRKYIKDHPLLKTFKSGSPQEGGDSVTIVELK